MIVKPICWMSAQFCLSQPCSIDFSLFQFAQPLGDCWGCPSSQPHEAMSRAYNNFTGDQILYFSQENTRFLAIEVMVRSE